MTASHFISNSVCPLCCFYFENRGHLHSVCYPHLRSPPPHLTPPSSLNYHGARDQPVASLFSHVTPGRAPHFADGAPLMWMRVLIGLHTSPLTNMKKQNKQKKKGAVTSCIPPPRRSPSPAAPALVSSPSAPVCISAR